MSGPLRPPDRDAGSTPGRSAGAARDRHVLLLLGAVVTLVLALDLLSAVVPPLDAALADLPVVVVVLVLVTGLSLLVLVRRR